MGLLGTGLAVAGLSALKGVLTATGVSAVAYSGYRIVHTRRKPPEIIEVLTPRVYPADMKKSPVVSITKDGAGKEVYRVKIPKGKSVEDFRSCIPAIQDQFGIEAKVWAEDGLAVIECLSVRLPTFLRFSPDLLTALDGMECGVLIGEGRLGLRAVDLAHPSTPHLLVAGMTGGGKSNFLNVLICGTALNYSPEEVQFYLVDLKDGVEFAPYERLPHVQSIETDGGEKRFVDNVGDCIDLLHHLAHTLQERNRLFREAGVRNISEYRRLGGKMPHIIVVSDEIADFAGIPEKKVRDAVYNGWANIMRKGRSAGVHCVPCTQIPDAEVVPRQLKGNLPVKLAFRMLKRENSETVFDSDVACHIPPVPGRAVMKIGEYENIQVPYLPTEAIEREILPNLALP